MEKKGIASSLVQAEGVSKIELEKERKGVLNVSEKEMKLWQKSFLRPDVWPKLQWLTCFALVCNMSEHPSLKEQRQLYDTLTGPWARGIGCFDCSSNWLTIEAPNGLREALKSRRTAVTFFVELKNKHRKQWALPPRTVKDVVGYYNWPLFADVMNKILLLQENGDTDTLQVANQVFEQALKKRSLHSSGTTEVANKSKATHTTFRIVAIILVTVVFVVLLGVGYYYFIQKKRSVKMPGTRRNKQYAAS